RIEAARAGRRFPRVFEMLLQGELSVTTVQLVGRRLTSENHLALLQEAAGKSKMDVQRLLARWFPPPDVPDSTRKLPTPPPAAPKPSPPAAVLPAPASAPAVVAPLSPDRYKVTFTADT